MFLPRIQLEKLKIHIQPEHTTRVATAESVSTMPVVCSANTKDKVKKFKEYTNRDRKDAQTIGTNIYLYIGRPLVPKPLVFLIVRIEGIEGTAKHLIQTIGKNYWFQPPPQRRPRTIGTRLYTKVHPTPN